MHRTALAIDPARTKILEDAVSVERLPQGQQAPYRLWIHLADPACMLDQRRLGGSHHGGGSRW